MKDKKQFWTGFFILAVCFLFSFLLLAKLIIRFNERQFYKRMAAVVSEVSETSVIIHSLKEPTEASIQAGESILNRYGYHGQLLTENETIVVFLFAGLAAVFLFLLCTVLFYNQHKQIKWRIMDLTRYLKQINTGNYPLRPYCKEDRFSLLEDELYKTVIALRESRNEAILTKENLAKNLADLSHQLKTPLTSLSLMAELLDRRMKNPEDRPIIKQILSQTDHLTSLTAALLTLSRMDAGVFQLDRKETSAEELIACAMELILPFLNEKQQKLLLEGDLECNLVCDIGWTAEGIGNILKNCSEHTPENSEILITVRQNPIFTEFVIEDKGEGFDETDLPHIFERFYRGKHCAESSTGIGLSLACSIMERQNGEITAENQQKGGARFRIKFYKF